MLFQGTNNECQGTNNTFHESACGLPSPAQGKKDARPEELSDTNEFSPNQSEGGSQV